MQVCAVRILRRAAARLCREIRRRSNHAMRKSGPMRTAIMSFSTCSPSARRHRNVPRRCRSTRIRCSTSTLMSGYSGNSFASAGHSTVHAAARPAVMRMLPGRLFAQLVSAPPAPPRFPRAPDRRAQQPLARLRRRDAARGARQQPHAQPRLQPPQRLAQRRLRNPSLAAARVKLRSRATARKASRSLRSCPAPFRSPAYKPMRLIRAYRRRCAAPSCRRTHKREGSAPWISNAPARSPPAKAPRTGSPARCASIRCSPAPDRPASPAPCVTFEPGARTAWHTHPLGQTLIVTAGCGRVQREGGPIEEIRPGDVVWFAPGEKHWHGAAPTTAHDPHRHPGEARRQGRRLDGARHRRAIRRDFALNRST